MPLEDLTPWFENLRNPSENVDAETIISNITSVYEDDLSIRDTAVQAREAELEKANEAIRTLKEKNYDLLMKSGAGNVPDNGGENSNKPDPDERGATVTFADIFKK